jgi:hypothetical protein
MPVQAATSGAIFAPIRSCPMCLRAQPDRHDRNVSLKLVAPSTGKVMGTTTRSVL